MRMSVALALSRAAVSRSSVRSSCFAGRRSSGKLPSAWRLRKEASAGAVRRSASAKAPALTPSMPMRSARALSIDWRSGMLAPRPPLFRGNALRPADDRYQEAGREQAFGHALGVLERDRIDECRPALDVVDAQVVELHVDELVRDLARSVEPEREGTLEVGLSLLELFGGWSVLGHARDFA